MRKATAGRTCKDFLCPACHKIFATQDSLAYHIRLDCLVPSPPPDSFQPRAFRDRIPRPELRTTTIDAVSTPRSSGIRGIEGGDNIKGHYVTSVGIWFEHEVGLQGDLQAEELWSHIASVVRPLFSKLPGPTESAAVIDYVIPGGPADRVNLKRGDVLVRVDGQTATSKNVSELLKGTDRVGSVVAVTAKRGTDYMEVELVRTTAVNLARVRDVLASLDDFRVSSHLTDHKVSTVPINSSSTSIQTESSNAHHALTEKISAWSPVTGSSGGDNRHTNTPTSLGCLATLENLIIKHLEEICLQEGFLAEMLTCMQSEVVSLLKAIAAGIRAMPAPPHELEDEMRRENAELANRICLLQSRLEAERVAQAESLLYNQLDCETVRDKDRALHHEHLQSLARQRQEERAEHDEHLQSLARQRQEERADLDEVCDMGLRSAQSINSVHVYSFHLTHNFRAKTGSTAPEEAGCPAWANAGTPSW